MRTQHRLTVLLFALALGGCIIGSRRLVSQDKQAVWNASLAAVGAEGFTLQHKDRDAGHILAQRISLARNGDMIRQRLDIRVVEEKKGYGPEVRVFQGDDPLPLLAAHEQRDRWRIAHPRPRGGRKFAGTEPLPLRDMKAEQMVLDSIAAQIALFEGGAEVSVDLSR